MTDFEVVAAVIGGLVVIFVGLVVARAVLNRQTKRLLRAHVRAHRDQFPLLSMLVDGQPLPPSRMARPDERVSTITTSRGTVYGNPADRRCWVCGAVGVPMTYTLDGYICDGQCRSQEEQDAAGWKGG